MKVTKPLPSKFGVGEKTGSLYMLVENPTPPGAWKPPGMSVMLIALGDKPAPLSYVGQVSFQSPDLIDWLPVGTHIEFDT